MFSVISPFPSPLSDSLPKVIATGDQDKIKISLGLNIAGNVWGNACASLNKLQTSCQFYAFTTYILHIISLKSDDMPLLWFCCPQVAKKICYFTFAILTPKELFT